MGHAPHLLSMEVQLSKDAENTYLMDFVAEQIQLKSHLHKLSVVYPKPGIYNIQLFVDDWDIHEDWVYVFTDDWIARLEYYRANKLFYVYPIDQSARLKNHGKLCISKRTLDSLKRIYSGADQVKYSFEKCTPFGIPGDSMVFESTITQLHQYPHVRNRYLCLHLYGDHNVFETCITDSGYTHQALLHIGSVWHRGNEKDVSFLATDMSDTLAFRVSIKDYICTFWINNHQIIQTPYQHHVGFILGIKFESNSPIEVSNAQFRSHKNILLHEEKFK